MADSVWLFCLLSLLLCPVLVSLVLAGSGPSLDQAMGVSFSSVLHFFFFSSEEQQLLVLCFFCPILCVVALLVWIFPILSDVSRSADRP